MRSARRVLIIAASDSSGGAGLTRDIATLAELGTEARCAVTAVTVQTDSAVRATHVLAPDLISAQISAALEADDIGAIKIGMLGRREAVQALLATLPPRERIPIVLDPVLASSSGGALLDAAGQKSLRAELLPRVSLLTPNIPEAAALLDQPLEADVAIELLEGQAQTLLRLGPQAVLLKGGHARGGEVTDILAIEGEPLRHLSVPRIQRQRRGTGCSLSSAIAAYLAAGRSLVEACREAQTYVAHTLQRAQ